MVLKWNMFAGGSFAVEGKRSYQATTPYGKYDIDPISTQYGRHRGYQTYFLDTKGKLRGGLWLSLGLYRSPNEAKKICREHFERYFNTER